jgi:AcrR family transcriptional regulator
MSKQQTNKEIRYKNIVEAAEKLFTKNSWDKVQMQDIADEAGLGVATLFRYFPKKQRVIVAVAVKILSQDLKFFQKIHNETMTSIQKIEVIFQHLNRLNRPGEIESAKFIDIFDSNIAEIENYKDETTQYFKIRNDISKIVTNIVIEGQKDGSFPEGKTMTEEIMTMINSYALFSRKLAMMKSVLDLETNPSAEAQLRIMHDMYMERLK